MMEKLKDWIVNILLQIKNSIYRRINKKAKEFNFDTKEVFIDTFDDLENWATNFPWGGFSQQEEVIYTDESMVELKGADNSYTKLLTRRKGKINTFNEKNMEWARANLFSKKVYREYGAFEVIAKMYPARGVWSAPLWFVAANAEGSEDPYAVLPEPDVAEVYSENNPNKMNVKSNLHYGTDYEKNKRSIGARTHYISDFLCRWVSYGMIWKKDRIEFYYDGYLYRVVTNKDILKRLENGMYPIIGVGLQKEGVCDENEMEIKSFKYWKF